MRVLSFDNITNRIRFRENTCTCPLPITFKGVLIQFVMKIIIHIIEWYIRK